ncbi:hypothetical protein [uncultured Haemophilus sp.]|uniref:hypothetical protein n=1 Tax=uncultured Haemophilus sp. TaxID=237779 RepID=UPI0025833289|nr:hypothetical protein [uncultured Haemophilus sp.]
MSDNFTSNSEIKRNIKFISDNWSKLMIAPSFFGVMFLWVYLLSIGKEDIFPQLSFSSPGILLIFLLFTFLSFNFNLPIFIFKSLLLDNNKFNEFVNNNKILYVLIQPIAILVALVISYFCFYGDLNYNEIFYLRYFILLLVFLVFLCCIFNFDTFNFKVFSFDAFKFAALCKFFNDNSIILFPSFLYVITAFLSIFPLYVIGEVSSDLGQTFFWLIVIYLLFLVASCYVVLYDINLVGYLVVLGMIYILLFIAIAKVGDGFKLQRMILKPIGIAQAPSQSGEYLLRNEDFLELIERNKFEKYVNTIDARTYTYIHGYLILNVGDVRVICPHDFETGDNQRSNNQKLDFSRCLSLTSEDIKFMKKGFPKNNENVALMVTKIVMQIEKLVIAKNKNNCKKAENSKN